jgi:pyrroline-5-carboxylate reductase
MMLGAARPLLLVGGGKMGEALLGGWLRQGLGRDAVQVVEPDAGRRELVAGAHGIVAVGRPEDLPAASAPGALLLAVKPQTMDAALPAYAARVAPDTLVLSIAAGKPIALLERALGEGLGVVRAMPNTPAAVGRGVSVLCANASATEAQRELAERLMAAVGAVHWIEDEDLMHAVTAVSGSGPAYVFHLIEALAEAGARAGLPEPLAMELARGTVAGAGELARRSGETAVQLRANVTSPGGTTAAALQVLTAEDGLKSLMARAVAAAALRSRELA